MAPAAAESAAATTAAAGGTTTDGQNGKAPAGPPEAPTGMEREAALLEAFAEVPSISKLQAMQAAGGQHALTVHCTQRNLPANAQRKYTLSVTLDPGSGASIASQPAEVASDVLLTAPSPSGATQVVFKSAPTSDAGSCSMVLQRWNQGRMVSELQVPKALQGPLINDGYFASGAAWRSDEGAVAYTAEVPAWERTPAWGGPASLTDKAGPKSWRGVGTTLEDWGELNTGKRPPAVFVFDIERKEVLQAPVSVSEAPAISSSAPGSGSEPTMSYGQPVWAPDGSGLVVVGWPHQAPNFPNLPARLGVVYCYNRPAYLYFISVSRRDEGGGGTGAGSLEFGKAVQLAGPAISSALSPVFTPDGSTLVYLSHQAAVETGTHAATASLCTLPWPQATNGSTKPKVVVDVVTNPSPSDPASFPGLYSYMLLERPFTQDGTLLLTSQWRSQSAVVAVDLTNGKVAPLSPVGGVGAQQASYTLLAVLGNTAYATESTPNRPPQLVFTQLPASATLFHTSNPKCSAALTWSPVPAAALGAPQVVSDALRNLRYDVIQNKPTVGNLKLVFESIHIYPGTTFAETAAAGDGVGAGTKDGDKKAGARLGKGDGTKAVQEEKGEAGAEAGPFPTIICPHGGPHTAMPVGWVMPYTYLAALGYLVISPNYRGSTGFGQESLASLPRQIGTNDVLDCVAALQAAVDAGLADPARVAVVGGSHGGFLTAHLLGQHPDLFKAGVLRNPVCNLSLMAGITDIPDWCWTEAFGIADGPSRATSAPSPDDLRRLYDVSPIAHVDKVTAPMFFMLGAKDRRVDLKDGYQYIAALKARAATTAARAPRVITFPEDTHALDKPQTEFEQWVNVAWWLRQHGIGV